MASPNQAVEQATNPPRGSALDEGIGILVDSAYRSHTPAEFLRNALPVVGTAIHAAYAGIELRFVATVINETFAASGVSGDFWASTVQSFLTETLVEGRSEARLFRRDRGEVRVAILCTPLRGGNGMCSGAMVAVVPCTSADEARRRLAELSAQGTLIARLIDSVGTQHADEIASGTVSALHKVAQYSSETELAFALTNKLRTREACDQVALAGVDRNHVRILSISGLDEISERSPGVRLIRAAMEECLDLRRPIIQQDGPTLRDPSIATGCALHRTWSAEIHGAPVASIPLMSEDACVAILSIRRAPDSPFTADDVDAYRRLVEPYAGSMEMVQRANRSLITHVRGTVRQSLREALAPGQTSRKLALFATVLFALWCVLGRITYEVTTRSSVVPADVRHLATPFDAVLRTAGPAPGDSVRAGQLLCAFDTTHLHLELERMGSEIEIVELEIRQALAAGAPAELKLAQARRRELEATRALTEHQIERSVLRAPADGVLVQGDLRDRVGDVFTKGEPLFQLSIGTGWRLEVELPERAIGDISAGHRGRFASLARPEETHPFRIVRVLPSAEHRAQGNVVIAEAEAEISDLWMRAGMEGVARVEVGKRAPLWVVFHNVVDTLRLNLWL